MDIGYVTSLCRTFAKGEMDKGEFVLNVKAQCCDQSLLGSSLLLKRVEKTINKHICTFWNECKEKCQWETAMEEGSKFTWEEEMDAWRPLEASASMQKRRKWASSTTQSSPFVPGYNKSFFCSVDCTCYRGAYCPHRNAVKGVVSSPITKPAKPSSTAVSFDKVPLVDVGAIVNPNSTKEERMEVAKLIGTACEEVGFLYIKNHGISTDTLNQILEHSRQFFAKSEADKLAASMKTSKGIRGYFAVGEENVGEESEAYTTDLKEGFDMGHDEWVLPDFPPGSMLNRFPKDTDTDFLFSYRDQLVTLARSLTRAFALALALEEGYFVDMFTKPMITLRQLHYPPTAIKPENELHRRLGCGAHTDYGCCTLLLQDTIGGLQVQNVKGEWVDVKPIEGTFVVNIGDMMQRWTNGKFKSTVHRVLSSPQSDRYSVPFFFNPNSNAVIRCVDTCRDQGEAAESATCNEILMGRYKLTMAHLNDNEDENKDNNNTDNGPTKSE